MSSATGRARALATARVAGDHLDTHGFADGRLEAELLLAGILRIDRLQLYLQYDRPLEPQELEAMRDAVRRRLRHEPIQYIIGRSAFRELELRVDARALVPRPETERLVEIVLEWAAARAGAGADEGAGEGAGEGEGESMAQPEARLSALDIGTGTGAIALSLLREGRFERVIATDSSADALALAAENARELGLEQRLEVRQGATWEPVHDGERFDVVVSNPPYVAELERESLPRDVVEWEPASALFAGTDGLTVLHAIVDGAATRLEAGGLLALEVGLGQAADVAARVRGTGCFSEPVVHRDLTGKERMVAATRA